MGSYRCGPPGSLDVAGEVAYLAVAPGELLVGHRNDHRLALEQLGRWLAAR